MRFIRYVRLGSPYAVWFIFVMICGGSPSAMASVGYGDSSVFGLSSAEHSVGVGDSSPFALDPYRMTRGWGDSEPFEVLAAVANAGDDFFGYESHGPNSWQKYVVQLDGTGSLDADSFLWEQAGGVSVALNDPSAARPIFDAPQWDGSTELTKTQARLSFRLTINPGDMLGERTDEVTVYIRIPGDANGDDAVNAFDLAKLRQVNADADFDGNGRVDAFDVSIFRQNAGRRRTAD